MKIDEKRSTPYEINEFHDIIKWQNEKPSVVREVIDTALKPATWAIKKIIPAKAIQGALTASDYLASALTDSKDIKRDGNVDEIKELRHKDLELSDRLANNVHNWANSIAALEGVATGATGLPGMIVDIPTLITMGLRVIHKIGLCYGYECKTEQDKQFIYGIISAAGANTVEEKTISVATLQRMNVIIAKTTWKKITEKAAQNPASIEAVIIAIKQLTKQLSINLTKRKALQAIPVVGGLVGASMNLSYINDIAWAARRSYQERWLMDNGKIKLTKTKPLTMSSCASTE